MRHPWRKRGWNRVVGACATCALLAVVAGPAWAGPGQEQAGATIAQQARPEASEQQKQPPKPPDQQPAGEKQQPPEKQAQPEQQVPPLNVEVTVTAARIDVPLKENPAATSVVTEPALKSMPRAIAAEEAFRTVPGVKVDNQADGERVHISIRGQGLLTERGIRGIKVLLDGLPLNDPTGFAPDLFDVDWSTVRRIEVVRGPASALYGGGSAGGVISIATRDGAREPLGANGTFTLGDYGFWKGFAEAGGTSGNLNYRVSASHNSGDGYRVHTAFDATNVYGKLRWNASENVQLTVIGAGTSFFNQNAEGLNLTWLEQDRRMANPDALTFNEYQQTHRGTGGVTGRVQVRSNQEALFSVYYRRTGWVESVPSSVQHRTYNTPGAIFQYVVHSPIGRVQNHVTLGTDLDWQSIDDVKHPNLGGAVEGPEFLADQSISQRGLGFYLLDRVEFGPHWSVVLDLRNDRMRNELTDHLRAGGVDLSGTANFGKTTGRVGAAWNRDERFGLYASWGQGFLPPATEELANNPVSQGGFNPNLVPATSTGQDIGARGSLGNRFAYDVAFFHLDTDNDFLRYRVPERPLETFYRNAGTSRRYGLETALGWYPLPSMTVSAAYTFSDFKYTKVSSLFGDFSDVYMPNAPRHQAYVDVEYRWNERWVAGVGTEMVSSWFVDQTNEASTDGYALVNPRLSYRWKTGGTTAEIMLSVRNLFGTEYIAFTEPDPDGNSYQPGPTRQIFLGARIRLGR
jgi:iron complex outermembrane recepter protein